MLTWLKTHRKKLNFFGGIVILLLTVVLYYWSTTQAMVANESGKTAQEKRMDRSVGHSNIIVRKSQKSKDMSVFSKNMKNSKQAETFLLFLMIMGFGMVGYSLYIKYQEKSPKA